MTLTIRDCSDYDPDPISIAGMSAMTHKATEGTSIVHQQYGPRLNAWHGQVPVLGSYHVVRTPSSGGSLAAQLQFWVSRMDSQTPWWRDYPFILQVDAERWPYDDVQPSTVLAFAEMLATSGLPGWKVTYASRGQYGDSLAGIATPLWNADYRGNGSYLGDGWTTSNGAPAGWAPYSGQVPDLLQWNGGPDLNAFRGSAADLLNITTGGTMGILQPDDINQIAAAIKGGGAGPTIGDLIAWLGQGVDSRNGNAPVLGLPQILAAVKALSTPTLALTDADRQAIIAGVAAQLGGKVDALTVLLTHVEQQLAAAGHALES